MRAAVFKLITVHTPAGVQRVGLTPDNVVSPLLLVLS